MEYDAYTLDVKVYLTGEAIGADKISATAGEYDESKNGIPITLTNNSGMYVKGCDYAVILRLNGEVVYSNVRNATDVPSGQTKEEIQYLENKWNKDTQKYEHVAYDSVEVHILNVSSVNE
ncbi:MAG: hypothetical protein SPL59_09115 [Catonella sp.]|nr:hypothetical protein [Catonella sp.]